MTFWCPHVESGRAGGTSFRTFVAVRHCVRLQLGEDLGTSVQRRGRLVAATVGKVSQGSPSRAALDGMGAQIARARSGVWVASDARLPVLFLGRRAPRGVWAS